MVFYSSPAKMPNSFVLLSSFLVLFATTASAFNISRLLEHYQNYGTFNSLLNQTDLVPEINSRRTITVLAIQDGDIGELAGKPTEVQKAILCSHVILDYYDIEKLQGLKKGTILTTLYQTTGVAQKKQGFLNVTVLPNGNVAFGSAMKGGSAVILKEAVAAQPYNISVLRVSGPIVAPGIDPSATNQTAPKEPIALPPGPLHKNAPPPEDDADSPASDDEGVADAPVAESPGDSPTESPTDAPAADAPAAEAPSDDVADKEDDSNSSSQTSSVSSVGLLVALTGSLLVLY